MSNNGLPFTFNGLHLAPPIRPAKRKPVYPEPADVGDPPDVVREWAEKVIASWGLTPKESEVCHYILQGFPTDEIAEYTGNSPKCIKHHIYTIFKKAGVGSRAELFAEILRI